MAGITHRRGAPRGHRERTSSVLVAAAASLGLMAFTAAAAAGDVETRSFDGTGNNLDQPTWGAAGTWLMRRTPFAYADGVSAPSGTDRPSARLVSTVCGAQSRLVADRSDLTDLFVFWGQFIDHDLDLTTDPGPELIEIEVPLGDPYFDPFQTGTVTIPLFRSLFDPATGTGPDNPRRQINTITAWLDASQVYGSSAERADALRTHDGTGKLRMSEGGRLPYNTLGLEMANPVGWPAEELFAAGDIRANENCNLLALHTLFHREHNRLCDEIAAADPKLTGDEVFHRARRMVIGIIQQITYAEFLPRLLGRGVIPRYEGYRPDVDPTIANAFQTVAYRFGHTMVNEIAHRRSADGSVHPMGHLALRDAFFAPHRFAEVEVEAWLMGAAYLKAQEVDNAIVPSLRNFLFGPPGAGGLDLFSLNAQRARDHGLPGYNEVRVAYGLEPATDWSDISSDPKVQADLEAVYCHVDLIDPWVGGLAEDRAGDGLLGELMSTIIADQFIRIRDGDRFWFEIDPGLTLEEISEIRATTLADLIERNTSLEGLPRDLMGNPGAVASLNADLTLDGVVDTADLVIVVQSWGPLFVTPGQDPRSDIDGDGFVGVTDLLVLLSEWR